MKNLMVLESFVGKLGTLRWCSSVAVVLIALLCSPDVSFAKGITIKRQNSTLESVVLELEALSGSQFVYNASKVDMDQRVSISVDGENMTKVLQQLANEASIEFLSVGNKYVLRPVAKKLPSEPDIPTKAKAKVVGTVIDAGTDEPLPGAAVIVQGTTIGVISDFDGKFSLNIVPGKYQ